MTRFLAACAITFGAITIAKAQDQPICAETATIKRVLKKAGELPTSGGLLPQNGVLLEIYASPNGRTFSLVITDQHGQSCITKVGTDWVSRDMAGLRT